MIELIKKIIKNHNLIPSGSKVLLGLSGGSDSVFLLQVLYQLQLELNFELIAIHLDHQWRADSHKDAQFCAALCKKLEVPIFILQAKDLGTNFKQTGSKEDLGRKMRRLCFEKIAHEQNANLIALAHHLQDQEENFFIRLIRGTSLSGLVGMKYKEGQYIRPLLEVNKKDILKYLYDNKINFVIDPSNESPEFLRNRIRSSVIPELIKADKRFDENFLRTLNKLKDTENFLQTLTKNIFESISFNDQNNIGIDLKKFFALDKFMQYRILFEWLTAANVKFELSEKFLNEIHRFLKQPGPGKHNLSQDWYIQKIKNQAVIVKN